MPSMAGSRLARSQYLGGRSTSFSSTCQASHSAPRGSRRRSRTCRIALCFLRPGQWCGHQGTMSLTAARRCKRTPVAVRPRPLLGRLSHAESLEAARCTDRGHPGTPSRGHPRPRTVLGGPLQVRQQPSVLCAAPANTCEGARRGNGSDALDGMDRTPAFRASPSRSVDLYKRRVQYATRQTIGQSRAPLHRALRTKCAHRASAETWLLNR